ncbi:Protein kinase family protein [Rhynchospora pubera]|uniref:Protein kinase family protein n=1 Tax=Rhynchospora pubera TaxID=906938 RepID=A0AAV8HRG8_9POAL|nr:Protein kinase family protein [Rhynchospora pubera]
MIISSRIVRGLIILLRLLSLLCHLKMTIESSLCWQLVVQNDLTAQSGCFYSSTEVFNCENCKEKQFRRRIIIVSTMAGTIITIIVFLLFFRRMIQPYRLFRKNRAQENIVSIIKQHGSFAPIRYRYVELKKITNSFHNKLGKGGFGSVFKGNLENGCFVAVKLLHDSSGTGEEFVNEVISIGRTSHANIVGLIGFCIEKSYRALIYEYMPNGSLDKYIYSENPKANLGWEKLYDIAVGVARGLEYLHRGCSTRIVHFDIKPQNILLDEDFCPKIADFGSAKLCPPKESIISLAEMRGTIGYIAPEVFSRNFGVVSTKSDVYSYGMMVLEMVGGRRNSKPNVENSSQAYFPHLIYDRLAERACIEACDATIETEELARKMALIGLWCTQTTPANRPSMCRVVELFERRLDELEMPPKPY